MRRSRNRGKEKKEQEQEQEQEQAGNTCPRVGWGTFRDNDHLLVNHTIQKHSSSPPLTLRASGCARTSPADHKCVCVLVVSEPYLTVPRETLVFIRKDFLRFFSLCLFMAILRFLTVEDNHTAMDAIPVAAAAAAPYVPVATGAAAVGTAAFTDFHNALSAALAPVGAADILSVHACNICFKCRALEDTVSHTVASREIFFLEALCATACPYPLLLANAIPRFCVVATALLGIFASVTPAFADRDISLALQNIVTIYLLYAKSYSWFF